MGAVDQICFEYKRRQPELTPCYKVIQEHLATFVHERELENRPLPPYVFNEFEAYLKCGILAHGFLRLKCCSCSQEKVVGFSCKNRGFCPSCAGKRMIESASHLVENVLPLAPYRQFVLSFPMPLRYWFQTNRKLFSKVHSIVTNQITRLYKTKALSQGIKKPITGSISYTQRFGSSLNLNPHIHALWLDGVFTEVEGNLKFQNVSPITDDEVADLITAISEKVICLLKKMELIDSEGNIVQNPLADPLFADYESLALATRASITSKIAFGPNAGKTVTKIGSGFGFEEEIPLAKGKLCFSINGFSLHANSSTNTHQRERLSQLIQYMARGPFSNERLEILPSGNIKFQLKTPYPNGVTHLLFTPSEFLEKLTALIPPPRQHQIRWSGCFATKSPYLTKIRLKPEAKKGFDFADKDGDSDRPKNSKWARNLAKAFGIDVLKCNHCGGSLKPIAALTDPDAIKRYLTHVGLDPLPPARAPPRSLQESFDFMQEEYES